MEKNKLTAYAHTLLTVGLNLQPKQLLVISADVEHQAFVRIVSEEAYRLGAGDVQINWYSTYFSQERLRQADEEALRRPPYWQKTLYQQQVENKGAFLKLISPNEPNSEGITAERLDMVQKAGQPIREDYMKAIMSSAVTWCVAAVATEEWADLLGLEGTGEEKVDALWEIIFTLCRVANVEEADRFENHVKTLEARKDALNEYNFTRLYYTCPNGTNLMVGLPKNHLWQGGIEPSQDGTLFSANIPTEEVYTAPAYNETHGVVYSTKPLLYQNHRIEDFSLTFRDGKVVDYSARVGYEYLRQLIETDEGSAYLGEVALVDHFSPISQSGRVYSETLFDENASCHFALGAAYPTCLEGGSDLKTPEELRAHGLNHSHTHVDFMIGHEQMTILGETADGRKVIIMQDGRLQI